MRLQTALQGLPKARRRARGDELIERVGLADAADRKVRGYSGGMKRRLDLALALVHSPRVLFLDEPTTGLDPSSRSDLWNEVARLAREDGVTVFLTTQYLEEADVLADRVGIIDAGPDRRRGHAGRAEGGDRPPVGRGRAGRGRRPRRARRPARAASGPSCPLRRVPPPCVSRRARISSPSCARSTPRTCAWRNLQLHQPSLDDVFLAKTGHRLEGGDEPAPPSARESPRERPRAEPGDGAALACCRRSGSPRWCCRRSSSRSSSWA